MYIPTKLGQNLLIDSDLMTSAKIKNELNNLKSQSQHVETFRNELIKSREENESLKNEYEEKIKELNDTIDFLNLSPSKRKKAEESKKKADSGEEINTEDTPIKDGGNF